MNIMPDEALDAALSIGEYSSRSDAACKEALACKEVLVRILQGCVPEYRNCTEEEIAACIEGQPLVAVSISEFIIAHPPISVKQRRVRFLYQERAFFKSGSPLAATSSPSTTSPAPACPKASPTAPTSGLAGIMSRL